ncbi:MAG: four helix bundle protein [Patescibacteria group bacterium]|jgi:four helix bundle protein
MGSKIRCFEDVIAWQKARTLSKNVYKVFAKNKDYSFRSQINRASISISNNIAEGFERHTNKELQSFLYIAKGSCGEARSMIYLALDLGYISENNFKIIYNQTIEVSKLIAGFIKSLK